MLARWHDADAVCEEATNTGQFSSSPAAANETNSWATSYSEDGATTGIKAAQARIVCDRQTLEQLWRTHHVFNERLPALLRMLFEMRRGECGQTAEQRKLYQKIAYFVRDNSQNAEYLLNCVCTRNWKCNTAKRQSAKVPDENGKLTTVRGETWADVAAALSANGTLLYEKQTLLGDLPGPLRQMVCRECAAILKGHDELTQNWIAEHQKWLRRKVEWESDEEHQKYLALRDRFEAFEESVGGKVGKRRGRWHLYLNWLRENPDLPTWCG